MDSRGTILKDGPGAKGTIYQILPGGPVIKFTPLHDQVKENMFQYQTTTSGRKWFLTQRDKIINVDHYHGFYISNLASNWLIFAYNSTESPHTLLGEFDEEQKAKDYLKEIYAFLVKS